MLSVRHPQHSDFACISFHLIPAARTSHIRAVDVTPRRFLTHSYYCDAIDSQRRDERRSPRNKTKKTRCTSSLQIRTAVILDTDRCPTISVSLYRLFTASRFPLPSMEGAQSEWGRLGSPRADEAFRHETGPSLHQDWGAPHDDRAKTAWHACLRCCPIIRDHLRRKVPGGRPPTLSVAITPLRDGHGDIVRAMTPYPPVLYRF